jgi:hypothetical protein
MFGDTPFTRRNAVMDALSKLWYTIRGFRSSGGHRYPCHWCGILTTLLDAEDFHVCQQCQKEYIAVGYSAMKEKYPLTGKDERNSLFFEEETKRNIARAKRLTKEELLLIVERGAAWAQENAQAVLDGKTLDDNELDHLGHSAEQYVDTWQ